MGVSGGPDSAALLALLKKMERSRSLTIYAAHLNHGLSHQGLAFERTAQTLAKKLGVQLITKKVHVKTLSRKWKTSLEDAGRKARYQFFLEASQKLGATKIATAHTLDEQAETVLMKIVRGAGLRGLAGIPVIRPLGPLSVIRPLIGITKKECLLFLKNESIAYLLDDSNQDKKFTRNRMRHDILPKLEQDFNPRISEALSDLAATVGDVSAFIEKQARLAWKQCLASESSRRLKFFESELRRLEPCVLDEVLWMAIERLRGARTGVGYSHIQGVRSLIETDERGLQIHLPGGLRVRKDRSERSLTPRKGKTIISLQLLSLPRKGG